MTLDTRSIGVLPILKDIFEKAKMSIFDESWVICPIDD